LQTQQVEQVHCLKEHWKSHATCNCRFDHLLLVSTFPKLITYSLKQVLRSALRLLLPATCTFVKLHQLFRIQVNSGVLCVSRRLTRHKRHEGCSASRSGLLLGSSTHTFCISFLVHIYADGYCCAWKLWLPCHQWNITLTTLGSLANFASDQTLLVTTQSIAKRFCNQERRVAM